MIINNYKCVFVHVPRTGGTSIEKFFIDNVDEKLKSQVRWVEEWENHEQHLSIQEMLKYNLIDENIMKSYTFFGFVRNPWDLMLSEYKRHQTDKWSSFEKYILAMPTLIGSRYTDKRFIYIQPQHKYFDTSEICENLVVKKFESLCDSFDDIKELIGLPEKNLPHENPSTKSKPYQEFYTPEMKSIVRDIYAEDIERYNYEF